MSDGQEFIDTEFESIVKSTLSDTWMNNLNAFEEQQTVTFPGFFVMFKTIFLENDEEEYDGGDNGEWIF
tara:strand:- start:4241 stop:4447 length:207 start_codon:yes stop_codon:yes gene_type:complete